MLVTVSLTGLCLQLPYMTLYIVNGNKKALLADAIARNPSISAWLVAFTAAVLPLSTVNYAVNFLLYCVSGSTFRLLVVQLVQQCSRRYVDPSRRAPVPKSSAVLTSLPSTSHLTGDKLISSSSTV